MANRNSAHTVRMLMKREGEQLVPLCGDPREPRAHRDSPNQNSSEKVDWMLKFPPGFGVRCETPLSLSAPTTHSYQMHPAPRRPPNTARLVRFVGIEVTRF